MGVFARSGSAWYLRRHTIWRLVLPHMSGKRAFLELLKQEGVEFVFGNPGTTELPLMDAFATESEIRYLLGLQEAAIMSMADGYAQASGKLAVCNFHTTPGLGNALGMLYDAQKAPTRIAPRTRGDRSAIEAAADILARAERPVIMAGDAVAQSHAHKELVALAELLGAPVYAEFVPNTASYPTSHPLFRGQVTRLAPATRKVLEDYDVLFSVGADLFTLSLPSDVDPMPPDITLIHLDVDPWELGKNYPPEVAILGDPKATLPELTAMLRERMTSGAKGIARDRLKTASDAIAREREALRAKARALAGAVPVQGLALL